MTALKEKIGRLIEAAGPISVADYMAACLYDPRHGYYTTREPFGEAGDFTTAPEISQMFGELVGVWAYAAWDALGRPLPVTLAEIGPGRGTLMKDMLRTLRKLAPGFVADADVAMIEASPRLVEVQKTTLAGAAAAPNWFTRISALSAQPLILVGNEIFDAIPVRQYVKTPQGWRERLVALNGNGALHFIAGPGALDARGLPPDILAAPEGTILELAPARAAMMSEVAARLAKDGGAALFFDYGYEGPALGDTLQAVKRHGFDDVLAYPGEADLTAHVDFGSLARHAESAGLKPRLMTQGDFLLGMGLKERAERLAAGRDAASRARILADAERLAAPKSMGNLFKALAILPPGVSVPPFPDAD